MVNCVLLLFSSIGDKPFIFSKIVVVYMSVPVIFIYKTIEKNSKFEFMRNK